MHRTDPRVARITHASLAILLSTALSPSCNSAHQMSGADTLPSGEARYGVGSSFSVEPDVHGDEGPEGPESGYAMQALFWLRHGVTEKTEAYVMAFGFFSGAKLGLKHQVLGTNEHEGLAVSLGLEVAGQVAPDYGDYTNAVRRVDIWLPIHLGYRVSASTALYLSPRYARRLLWIEGNAASQNIVGGVLGVALGRGTRVHMEASAFHNLTGFGGAPGAPSDNEFGLAAGISF